MFLKIGQIFPFYPFHRESKRVIDKKLFQTGANIPMPITLLSGLSAGSVFVTSDYTSLYRSFEDFAKSLWGHYSKEMNWMGKLFSSKDLAVSYQTFGSVTGINFLIGVAKGVHAYSRLKFSKAIDDKMGQLLGRVGTFEGMSLATAGVSFLAYRVLAVMGTIGKGASAVLIKRTAPAFAMAGLASYSAFFGLLSSVFGIRLWEGVQFKKELEKRTSIADQIDFLFKKINVAPEEVFAKLVKKYGSEEAAKKYLVDEAYSLAKGNLNLILKELNIPAPKEKVCEILDSLISQQKENLVMAGLRERVYKAQLKKQTKMGRILDGVGFEALKEIQSLPKLSEKVRSGNVAATKKAKELVANLKKGNERKLKETGIVFGVLLFGMVAMLLAIVLSGGTGLIVSTAVMLIFSILMAGVDGYYLYQCYQEDVPAPHDKKMLFFSSFLGLSSFLLMVILGLTGVVSFGIFPMILSCCLTTLWLGQNAFSWHIINRKQKSLICPSKAALEKVGFAKKAQLKILQKELSSHLVHLKGKEYTPICGLYT